VSQRFSLNVNGKNHKVDVDPDMPLLYALRNDVGRWVPFSPDRVKGALSS